MTLQSVKTPTDYVNEFLKTCKMTVIQCAILETLFEHAMLAKTQPPKENDNETV